MPELPEVETIVRDLRPLLVGRRILGIEVSKKPLRRKWSRAWNASIIGRSANAIGRRGKWILIDLGEPWLLVHLGMTGQFTVAPADVSRASHTHLVFHLDDGNELRFRDIRRFGSAALFPNRAKLDGHLATMRLGPEPFELEASAFHASLRATNRNLKAILLDQTVIAGVGNIYADESTFEAGLHPTTIGKRVRADQAANLCRAIVSVLTHAIEKRGASIRDYVGGSGLKGGFQDEFRVYGRTGEPCIQCATPIERIVLGGRSTHYCPTCQPKRG